ncbi:hypothetical protein AB0E25_41600 [Streptomyces bobili]|uniref:hypothetical protein n=1 Tax=Streptomyces bobili TaxID=67280 RepID=UPI0033C86C08
MNGFLGEIGKKLAERWVALLALPGLLFLAVATAAGSLGWSDALDLGTLSDRISRWAVSPAFRSPGGSALIIIAFLLGSVAAGLVAAVLGQFLSLSWNLRGRHGLARKLASVRRKRSIAAKQDADAEDASAEQIQAAIARADRLSLVEADRPTWIGDRLHACRVRVSVAYGIDIDAAWPRLWLLLPETARADISAARDAYTASARLMAWALLYLALTIWWWPAAPTAVVIGVTAWVKARESTANFTDLLESAVDLYGRELATRLGHPDPGGPITPAEGESITALLRKSRWDPQSPLAD